jgi:hypothetical protein
MVGAFPLGWFFPVILGVPAVSVEGSGDCPSPAAVSVELSAIMTVPDVESGADRVVVSSTGDEVSVGLFSAGGAVLGERRVSAEGSCEEKARAVAVILAAWLTDVHPEFRTALPEVAPPVVHEPAPAPPPELPAPSEPRTLAQPAPAPAPAARPTERPTPRGFSYAAAAGIALSAAGATPAFELSARFAPAGAGLGMLGFALAALPVESELGSGSVSSFRWPFGLGPLLRLAPQGAFVDLAIGPSVGWLHLDGDGFRTNDVADDLVFGGFLGVSVGGTKGFLRPHAAVGLLVWPGTSTAVASVPDAELDLPLVEATALLGVLLAP